MCLSEIPTTVTNTIHQQANMAPFISNSLFLLYLYFRFHDYKSYMYSEFLKYHKVKRCTIWILTPWLSASFDTSKIIAIASAAKLPTHGWQCKRTTTSRLILQSTSVHCFTWNNLIFNNYSPMTRWILSFVSGIIQQHSPSLRRIIVLA